MLIYSTPNTLCCTLSFNVSVLLLRAACQTSEIAAIFQNVKRERLTVNKLSFPNNWNSYGSRSSRRIVVIGSECLTKNAAVSQKCLQNVSKITQRHEYRLPSAAVIDKEVKVQFLDDNGYVRFVTFHIGKSMPYFISLKFFEFI